MRSSTSARGTYYGQFGYFNTNTPYVPDINAGFSLSHLYLGKAANGDLPPTTPQVEVGWYVGAGASSQYNYSTPHVFTAMVDAIGGYHEYDFQVLGNGSSHFYELTRQGYDYGRHKDVWFPYFDNFNSPLLTWYVDLPYKPSVGGEATQLTGIQMAAHGTPSQQVRTGDGQFHDWTPAYMTLQPDHTYACDDNYFNFRIITQFQDFTATGSGS